MRSDEPDADRLLILFPGALGDFLCALPTFLALQGAHAGTTLLVANPSTLELVEHGPFQTASIQRREVSDLFAAGPLSSLTRSLFGRCAVVHSWTGHDVQEFAARLHSVTGAAIHVHRFRGMCAGEHTVDYYARCVGVEPLAAQIWTTAADEAWADRWRERYAAGASFLLVHPGSGSARKNWEGFPELVDRWRAAGGVVAVVEGPAESERQQAAWRDVPIIRDINLRQLGALLQRAAMYVGNDSGVSHLAAAVGTPSLVLFGSSDPSTWAPRGRSVRVLTAPEPCPRCGPDRFCVHRLDVDTVATCAEGIVGGQVDNATRLGRHNS